MNIADFPITGILLRLFVCQCLDAACLYSGVSLSRFWACSVLYFDLSFLYLLIVRRYSRMLVMCSGSRFLSDPTVVAFLPCVVSFIWFQVTAAVFLTGEKCEKPTSSGTWYIMRNPGSLEINRQLSFFLFFFSVAPFILWSFILNV